MGNLSPLEILVVEDTAEVRRTITRLLKRQGYAVEDVRDGKQALHKLDERFCDIVITDYRMYPMDGMQLLSEIKKRWPATEVLMVTAFGSISRGVEAIKLGAFDYLTKPFENHQLLGRIERLKDERQQRARRRERVRQLRQHAEFDPIIGQSEPILELMAQVSRIAPTDCTVLIQGESGTGKELIARAIHAHSPRRNQPFVAINCGAIPETLQESELFGHVRGAFTGAYANRKGLFEVAHGGTVFLDEIGEMAATAQVKLLRFLQDNEIRRVGDALNRQVNVRLIAATNKDLRREVEEGRFREDLYYRIDVVPVRVPALRERKTDIALLVDHLLEKYGRTSGHHIRRVAKRALSMLVNYDWPGNVRELENVIQRVVAFAEGDVLTPELLPAEIRQRCRSPEASSGGRPGKLSEIETRVILETLRDLGGNRRKTAEKLGISKATLWRKLKAIEREQPNLLARWTEG